MDKKISELDQALQINNDAVFPISQDNGGTDTTYKVTITQISAEIGEDQTFSNLQTLNKTLVGALNELLAIGNPIIIGTTAPTAQQGEDGNLYVQYTEGVGGADDTVDGIFIKLDGAWCEITTGSGSGGHTIVDNAGTDLTQRTKLQFKGAYSVDNSTDDTTEVNVAREMTKSQFNQLTPSEKTGLINTTDEPSQINATEIPIESGSATDTKTYIDNIADYSTSEKAVGKWIDGRTVYQKVILINDTISNTWTTADTISGITRIVGAEFIVYEGGLRGGGVRQGLFAEISLVEPGVVKIYNNTSYNIQVDYLILKYVKS